MSRERQTRRTAEAGAPPRATQAADLQPAEARVLGDIPWGYGEIRVTAMPVDPYWVFVYWYMIVVSVHELLPMAVRFGNLPSSGPLSR